MPWQALKEVTIDFVSRLPQIEDYNAICVIISRLTKQRHYILYADIIDVCGTANLYYFQIYHLYSLLFFYSISL